MAVGSEAEGSGGQVVAFRLGREIFAIDILFVQEVLQLQNITAIPNAPSFVHGVIDVRGRVVPIIDLRQRLGMQVPDSRGGRIIILDFDGKLLGLHVDAVHKVLALPHGCREELPDAVVQDRKTSCLASLAKTEAEGIIVIVDPTRILTRQQAAVWAAFEDTQPGQPGRKQGGPSSPAAIGSR